MTAEITAIISSQYAIQDLIEIGDALLAAPILAVEVMLDSANAYTAINELRHRAGNHMCVAARNIQTPEQAARAIDADAQYLVCTSLNTAAQINAVAATQSQNIPCIPTISKISGLLPNIMAFNQIRFRPSDTVTTNQMHLRYNSLPNTQVFIDLPVQTHSEITNQINAFVHAGTAGIAVGQAIVSGCELSMADIITNARMLTVSWKTALSYK